MNYLGVVLSVAASPSAGYCDQKSILRHNLHEKKNLHGYCRPDLADLSSQRSAATVEFSKASIQLDLDLVISDGCTEQSKIPDHFYLVFHQFFKSDAKNCADVGYSRIIRLIGLKRL